MERLRNGDEGVATPFCERAVCGFLMVFWTVRLVAAHFFFDLRPYLTDRWRRIGLHLANLVFAALPVVYGWVAFAH